MPEIGTSGSMSGDGKRSVAEWPKLPRPSSTLPCPSLGSVNESETATNYWLIAATDSLDRTIIALNRDRAASTAAIVTIISVGAISSAIIVSIAITTHRYAANRRVDREALSRRRRHGRRGHEGDTKNRYDTGKQQISHGRSSLCYCGCLITIEEGQSCYGTSLITCLVSE
jgi:hypothetical protein